MLASIVKNQAKNCDDNPDPEGNICEIEGRWIEGEVDPIDHWRIKGPFRPG
jgi:hypothetical protein